MYLSIIFIRSFGLLTEPIPPAAMRSLVMIAKCLQNLANLVEFGGKEPYMEVVNPFILKNKERMVVFLDHLSSVRDKPYPDEDRVKVCCQGMILKHYHNVIQLQGDPARDLATVHHICESHLTELVDISKEMSQIKTLVTVTEMLSKHKQKYTEMLSAGPGSGPGGGGS